MNFTDFNNLKIQILRRKEFVPCTFLYLHLIRIRYDAWRKLPKRAEY